MIELTKDHLCESGFNKPYPKDEDGVLTLLFGEPPPPPNIAIYYGKILGPKKNKKKKGRDGQTK